LKIVGEVNNVWGMGKREKGEMWSSKKGGQEGNNSKGVSHDQMTELVGRGKEAN